MLPEERLHPFEHLPDFQEITVMIQCEIGTDPLLPVTEIEALPVVLELVEEAVRFVVFRTETVQTQVQSAYAVTQLFVDHPDLTVGVSVPDVA